MLLNEGAEILDLTPGDDPWKERFANCHDDVAEVLILPTKFAKWRSDQGNTLASRVKKCMGAFGVESGDAKRQIERVRRLTSTALIHKVGAWMKGRGECRIYRGDRRLAEQFQRDDRIAANAISDLLCFEAGEGPARYYEFLSDALTRLESGESVFTAMADGRLTHCGWMADRQRQIPVTEVGQKLALANNSAALHNFYIRPDDRGEPMYSSMIGHIVSTALADSSIDYLYILVSSDNLQARRVVENLGFTYRGSLHWKSRFGIESKWADSAFSTDGDTVRDAQL
jgi:hypothetical protein